MRGFEYLTNLAVRCPLPNPLPRGEGSRLLKIRGRRIGNQMAGKPENVQVWQLNPLSSWGEGIRLLKIRECRIGNQMAGKPEKVRVWQLNPLFSWGEGIRLLKMRGCRIENQMAGEPENVRVWQSNSLSPWERARERASKPQACLFGERYESVIRTRFGF